MADDLDDEWWAEEINEKSQVGNQDVLPEDELPTIEPEPPAKRKIASVKTDTAEIPQKKKKSKRKKISDVLAGKVQEPIKYTDLTTAITKHLEGKLSAVERDDIALTECHFAPCDQVSDSASSYLHTVMTVPKWKKKIKGMQQSPGAPLILVVCSAASRAVFVIRDLRSFCPEHCRIAKLFAKHIKLEEQAQFLKKTVIQVGVGTPNRIAALLSNDSLSLSQTCLVMLDWSWRDAKLRRLIDIPEIREDFFKLLQKYLVPRVKSGSAKFALF